MSDNQCVTSSDITELINALSFFPVIDYPITALISFFFGLLLGNLFFKKNRDVK